MAKTSLEKNRRFYELGKRIADIVISLAVLLILLVPGAVLCLVIYLDSPGASPIFAQKRCGLNGKEFVIYKFRTMVPHAEEQKDNLRGQNEMDGPTFKMHDDPRITRIGRFLRKTSIDELPQFLNVIRGDMAIVGPRPPLPEEVCSYNAEQRQRLSVTPGLTCYWQVKPDRNTLSFEEWVDLDLQYIEDRNILLDLSLILKTLVVMFHGEGI